MSDKDKQMLEAGGEAYQASASDDKSTSPEGRWFAVIEITLYDDARRERVLNRFGVSTWATEEHFAVITEFFLDSVRYAEVLEEMETELMK